MRKEEKRLTNRHNRLTNDHSLVVFLFELAGSHASEGFEGTEEGSLRREARLHPNLRYLDVRLTTYQVFGMFYPVGAYELRERTTPLAVDTVGYQVAVGVHGISHIIKLQFAIQIELLTLHQVADLAHEFRTHGDRSRGSLPDSPRILIPADEPTRSP